MRLAFTVLLVIAASNSVRAAEPALTAGGLYYVGSDDTPATLAFEVLPWTADVHQVRGYGRAVVGKDDPRELHFEIIGTYRPSRGQVTQGMFVQRSADGAQTTTFPWQGLYVPKDGSFQWLATVGGQLVPLPAAQFSGVSPNAAAKPATSKTASGEGNGAAPSTAATVVADPNGPSRASVASDPVSNNTPAAGAGSANAQGTPVALFAKYPTLELVKEIDLGKVVTDALAGVPSKPRVLKPRIVDGSVTLINEDPAGAATVDFINGVARLLGDQPAPVATAPASTGPASVAPAKPTPTNPAPIATTSTPNPVPAASTGNTPGVRTVPNVVGLSFENATNAIWAAGLKVGGVGNLGAATDPAKAERIIAQTPPAGSPYPADRSVQLQWYGRVEKLPTSGFQDGDGAKVDARLSDSITMQGGTVANFSYHGASERVSWTVYKADEPQHQQTVAKLEEVFTRSKEFLKSHTRSDESGKLVITEDLETQTENVFEYYQDSFLDDQTDFTSHVRHVYYRGFLIRVDLGAKKPRANLSPAAASIVENSKRLIDLRFPPKN